MLKTFWQGLCDLVFPKNCLLCKGYIPKGTDVYLCPRCTAAIEFNRPPFCKRCSRLLKTHPEKNLCPQCRHTSYHFDKAWAATVYNDTMQKLIHFFKYENRTYLANFFASLVDDFMHDYHIELGHYDYLVAIPLHRTRLRERGYNQTQLIADRLAKKYGIPMSKDNLLRVRHTKNQALLNQNQRWTNIQGAFKIKTPSAIQNKSMLLVDDLLTTGATASEAALALKNSGASRVDVLTLAIGDWHKDDY